jgi:protoporphyrinogen/coproporphyrinogen III oxidase
MLVDAAVAGISAGDSRRLSVRSQFPMMPDMEREHGSLIRAMLARRKQGKGPSKLLSFRGGLATLIDALAAKLGPDLHPQCGVRATDRCGAGWRVVTGTGAAFDADRVVIATSARAAAPIVSDLDPDLGQALSAIPYSGVQLVALAYRVTDIPRALDGYGYLVTRPEQLATLGVVWESSLFPGRAPEGFALLRAVLGGARRPDVADLTEDAATEIARADLGRVMGITAAPARVWTFRWPQAIAQYTIGHADRIAAIRSHLSAHAGLTVCGTSYDGVSFNQAIAAGRAHARALAASLPVKAAA